MQKIVSHFKLSAKSGQFAVAFGCLLLSTPTTLQAHGYVVSPMARQAICAEQGGYWWPADGSSIPNAACRAAFLQSGHYPFTQQPEFAALVADFHNQSAVEAKIKDGTLCAGGDTAKSGMNLPSADWQRTEVTPNVNGKIKIRFRAETPHNPSFWQFYLSKPEFDTNNDALKWADLDLVQEHGNIDFVKDADGKRYYEMYVALPAGRQGDAILFTRWQRVDPAGEGFYNCSDITIKSGTSDNTQWFSTGYYIAQGQEAKPGDLVNVRLFSETGQELINQSLKINNDNAANWPRLLADTLVLDHAQTLQIGVKDPQGAIKFDAFNLLANQVWVHNKDHSYYLSIKSQPDNTAPQVQALDDITMTELGIGNVHVHAFDDENDPLTYLWTVPAEFTYSVDGANLSLVAPSVTENTNFTISVHVSDGTLSTSQSFVVTVENGAANPWLQGKIYVGGDKVTFEGSTYEAKWWTLGEKPGTALVWRKL